VATVDLEIIGNSIGSLGAGTLASDPGSGGTTLTLTTGHGARFATVAAGQRMRIAIEDEILVCTAHSASADTMTVTRGAEGTTAAAHAAGTAVNVVATKATTERFTSGYVRQPRQNGLLAWTMLPEAANQNASLGAGIGVYSKVWIPEDMTAGTVHLILATSGVTVANAYVGLYDAAGTRVAVTAESAATFNGTAGIISIAFTGSYALTGGPDVYGYIGFVFGSAGTPPTLRGSSTFSPNLGQNASSIPEAYSAGSGLTALPGTLPAVGSRNASKFLAGLS
jgi:hypothetical protein